MIDYEQYHRDGFGVFDLSDLLTKEELLEFEAVADEAYDTPINDDTFRYVCSVVGFHNHPDWPFKSPASERELMLNKALEHGVHISQRWYESTSSSKLTTKLRNVVHGFIRKFYPEINADFTNIHHQDAISVYLDGDHTEVHRDGQNTGRVCVVLLYLTKEEYYNSSGELAVMGDEQAKDMSNAVRCQPTRGKLALLDFNNHNPFHGVLPVKAPFDRRCYISFVWNIDKMPNSIRPQGY